MKTPLESGLATEATVADLRTRLARLEALHRVNEVIHSTLELRESLELILREAISIVRGDSGLIALANPTTGFLEIEAAQGLPAATRYLRLRLGDGLPGRVARSGRSSVVADADQEPRMVRFGSDVGSEVAVPLRVADEVRGVISIQARRIHAFGSSELALLEDVAGLASPAIRNTWLY